MARKTDLIAYCGTYCPDCPSYTHEVADLAKDLRSHLRRQKFDKYASMLAKMPVFKAFKHYEKGYELLGAMMKIHCKNGSCRTGGWGQSCKIKNCAIRNDFKGCWQCDSFETCKTLNLLEAGRDAPHRKNLRKIRRTGPTAFVKAKAT